MATFNELRQGIATRLATISGLRVSATIPDQPNPPQAIVFPGRVLYDLSYSRGGDEYEFSVLIILGRVSERTAQASLDAYCNPSGPSSVKTAIEAEATLGGKAFDCRVTEMRGQSSLAIGDVTYLTAEFTITIIA